MKQQVVRRAAAERIDTTAIRATMPKPSPNTTVSSWRWVMVRKFETPFT